MKIGILAYNQCTASMILGMMDILSLANTQNKKSLFTIHIVTKDGKPINSFTNYPIQPAHAIRSMRFDLIYVPGFLGDPQSIISQEREIIEWLAQQHRRKVKLAAACNGNLLLAEAGVLKGKNATTHWSLKNFFQARYPEVKLQPERIIVDEGDIISAAGVTAYANLALYLIAKYDSIETASYCSKIFLVDSGRKVQTPYLIFSSPKSHGDPEVLSIQEWLETHYRGAVTIDSLLDQFNLSRRTLIRRFKKATGDSPLEYLQRIRIENAKHFLETTNKTFSEITWDVGYNDISSFQRLFKLSTRLTPREYRNKFTLVSSN
jgi:transcriptional regulator GlxA family with amidase domain